MKTITRLCLVLVLVSVLQVSEQQFISPCPEVFTYDQEGLTWVGRVEMPATNINNDLNLEVVLSLKRPLPSDFRGFITLKDDLTTVLQNIIFGRKITYIVNFPLKVEIPSVVSITFNGQNYCDGVKPRKHATIIRLEHKSQLKKGDDAPKTTKTACNRPPVKIPTRRTSEHRRYTPTPSTLRTTRKPINVSPAGITLSPNNQRWRISSTEPEQVTYNYDDLYGNIFKIKLDDTKLTERVQEVPDEESNEDLYEGLFNLEKQGTLQNNENNARPNKNPQAVEPNANDQSKDKTSDGSDSDDCFDVKQNSEVSTESKRPEINYDDYFVIETTKNPGKRSDQLKAEYIEDFINRFEGNTDLRVKKQPSPDVEYYDDNNDRISEDTNSEVNEDY